MKKWLFFSLILSVFLFSSTNVSAQFKDVPPTYPYEDAIMSLADYDIISGYPDNSFRPNQILERQQFAALLIRAIPVYPNYKFPLQPFKDVNFSEKQYQRIMPLQQAGFMNGTGNGYFQPHESLTRAQLATIFVRVFELEHQKTFNFKDIPSNHWAKKEIDMLADAGILLLDQKEYFYPDKPVTRGEYAELLLQALTFVYEGEIFIPIHKTPYVPKYVGKKEVLFDSLMIRSLVYTAEEETCFIDKNRGSTDGESIADYVNRVFLSVEKIENVLNDMADTIENSKSTEDARAFRTSYSYWKRTMEQKLYEDMSYAFNGFISSTGAASVRMDEMTEYLKKIEEWLHLYGDI